MATIIVCGGRGYADRAQLFKTLDSIHDHSTITLLVHGAAPGADSLAGEWAVDRGVPVRAFPADWKKNFRAAGPIRNQQMIDETDASVLVAFPGGKGTKDMIGRAIKAKLKVIEAN